MSACCALHAVARSLGCSIRLQGDRTAPEAAADSESQAAACCDAVSVPAKETPGKLREAEREDCNR